MFARELLPVLGPGAANAVNGSVAAAATAAGTTQATGTAITTVTTVCTTGTEGQGFLLPATMQAGDSGKFMNATSADLYLYPTSGGKLNNNTANVPVVVASKAAVTFTYYNGSDCIITL